MAHTYLNLNYKIIKYASSVSQRVEISVNLIYWEELEIAGEIPEKFQFEETFNSESDCF